MGKPLQSLLGSGNQFSPLQQAYYDKHLAPLLGPAEGEVVEAHNLVSLTVANDESLPLVQYTEVDMTFLGLVVPNIGFLVVKIPKIFINDKGKTNKKLHGLWHS